MDSPSAETPEASAAQLLKREARAMGGRVAAPVLLGLAGIGCGVAQAWLLARLLGTLLGRDTAGWPELYTAAGLAVAMAMLMRRFTFRLAVSPKEVGMATGATIHTANGMPMRMERRAVAPSSGATPAAAVAVS